jgi:succinate dehydrogenase / fumarate reductase, iron-sulfur subunit
MRLRRIATSDDKIVDVNNGERHEAAFTTLIRGYGLLHESELLSRSYGGNSWFGKFHPAAGKELLSSLPTIVAGVLRRKINPRLALFGHKLAKPDLQGVQRIYDQVEQRPQRYELNLFLSGFDEDDSQPVASGAGVAASGAGDGAAGEAASATAEAGGQGSDGSGAAQEAQT